MALQVTYAKYEPLRKISDKYGQNREGISINSEGEKNTLDFIRKTVNKEKRKIKKLLFQLMIKDCT